MLKNQGCDEILTSDNTYLERAMDFFKRKYDQVVFYVITEDRQRVKAFMDERNLTTRHKVAWPSKQIRGVDYSLIALADSAILSYGTFGLTAAALHGNMDIMFCPKGYEKEWLTMHLLNAKPINLVFL